MKMIFSNTFMKHILIQVPDTEEEERNEVKNTIQQTVSHFTSNANKVNKTSDEQIDFFDLHFSCVEEEK